MRAATSCFGGRSSLPACIELCTLVGTAAFGVGFFFEERPKGGDHSRTLLHVHTSGGWGDYSGTGMYLGVCNDIGTCAWGFKPHTGKLHRLARDPDGRVVIGSQRAPLENYPDGDMMQLMFNASGQPSHLRGRANGRRLSSSGRKTSFDPGPAFVSRFFCAFIAEALSN